MSFENNIQKWVSIDNEMKRLNEKLKSLRDEKNGLNTQIISYVNTNNLNDSQIGISDGKLRFATTKVAQPLTFKYLEDSLSQIIQNKDQVAQIVNHLKNKRITKTIPEIKRYYSN
uniref:Uncharacterized protein n=1 Tax=viral metagenome TaxID=1070528 RepID=A0A6C0LJ45_9ZZZZ